jgi:hypothetical protein
MGQRIPELNTLYTSLHMAMAPGQRPGAIAHSLTN